MQKRALPSTSSGQPSQPKKPCLVAINQERGGSEGNLVLSSYLTVEDVQRVVRKQVDCAISQWAENFQSCIGDALKDIAQRVCSTENAVQKLVRKEVECAISQGAENFQSIGDALKDMAERVCSMENAVQKLTEAVELPNIHSPHLARECRAIAKSTAKNDARNLQLQLQTKLSIPLFTGKKLEGEGGARIKVALIDADTGYVVASGPEASIKLDVIVLEGDFNKDDEENWTQEEFENYVVKEREGKRPLFDRKTPSNAQGRCWGAGRYDIYRQFQLE